VKTPVVTPVPPTSFPDSAGDNIPGQGAEKNSQKRFRYAFTSAGRIAKKIKKLGNTEALRVDGIQVSLLKKGVTILASPLSPCKHDFLRATFLWDSGLQL